MVEVFRHKFDQRVIYVLILRAYVVFLIDLIFVHLFQVFRQEVRGYGDRIPALLGKHNLYMQGKK